jgi:protease I
MELDGKRVVILAEDLYEDQELWYPLLRLREAGATVCVVGPKAGAVYKSKHGYPVTTDMAASDVNLGDVAGVVVPGGYAPDRLRRHGALVRLVRDVHEKGAVVAFICHGGWVPISAGILKGKRATSVGAIRDDMVNAGADWVDEAVVRDGNLVSSRTPDDLPVFCKTLIDALSQS